MKKVLKSIWDEFIYGGHLTALGAPSIAYTGMILLGIPIDYLFLFTLYFGAESIYLYDRYKDLKTDAESNKKRSAHISMSKNFLPYLLSVYVLLTVIIPIIESKLIFLGLLVILLLLCMTYSRFLKLLSRNIFGLKDFFVSVMWSIIPIMLIISETKRLSIILILYLVFLLLRETLNTWYCDIKDIEIDKRAMLKTPAVCFGKDKLLKILHLINLIPIILLILAYHYGIWPKLGLFLIFSSLYAFVYLLVAKKSKNEFLLSLVPDIEPGLYTVLILLGRKVGL